MEPLPAHPKLYEINTRVWLRRFDISSHRARLNHIPPEVWNRLASHGIQIVWLMGVWRTNRGCTERYGFSPDLVEGYRRALPDWNREDVIGSPYAIDDYILNPDLGSPEDLAELRKILHRHGMRLMLDFIPNHFSAHSHLIKEYPEIFLKGSEALHHQDPKTFYQPEGLEEIYAHGRDPYFPAWTDTIQVNYFNPGARRFMAQKLAGLSEICDGVRCDMSMLVLNDVFQNTWGHILNEAGYLRPQEEFWPGAIAAAKSGHPGFILMAEAYWGKEWLLQEMGFDFVYDKSLTDLIREKTAEDLTRHLNATLSYQERSVHFLENHDEERAITALGKPRSLAGAVIISTLPGLRFYHDGQFEGKSVRLPIQLGRERREAEQKDISLFYNLLLQATKDPVFTSGKWQLLSPIPAGPGRESHKNILAWFWQLGNERRLVTVNLSDLASQCRLKINLGTASERITFTDLLTGQTYPCPGVSVQDQGLSITLNAYESRILAF